MFDFTSYIKNNCHDLVLSWEELGTKNLCRFLTQLHVNTGFNMSLGQGIINKGSELLSYLDFYVKTPAGRIIYLNIRQHQSLGILSTAVIIALIRSTTTKQVKLTGQSR